MDKIKKQITVNMVLVVVSVFVIFLAKSYNADSLLGWRYWLGADIVFVMITSLATMLGWRFVEDIKGPWLYNILIGVLVLGLGVEYGLAIANCNDFLISCILISLILFLFFYTIENLLVVLYFKRREKDNMRNRLGYNHGKGE